MNPKGLINMAVIKIVSIKEGFPIIASRPSFMVLVSVHSIRVSVYVYSHYHWLEVSLKLYMLG
jgi:hypothetical protein